MRTRLSTILVLAAVCGAGLWWMLGRNRHPAPRALPNASAQAPDTTSQPTVKTADGSTRLWNGNVATAGEPLSPAALDAARAAGVPTQSRTGTIPTGSITALAELEKDREVTIPLPGGQEVSGVVNLVLREDGGTVRIGGSLTGARRGSFALHLVNGALNGRVLIPGEQIAYMISTAPAAATTGVREMVINEIICYPMPRNPDAASVGPEVPAGAEMFADIAVLSSRPAAVAVLYLDFDGAFITDPDWNDGLPFTALASTLHSSQIPEVWNRVVEDFLPFDLDVTTDPNRYLNAPVGRRMRVIITPTDTVAPRSGGVAYRDSFARAGVEFSADIPAWVFNSSVVGIAEAISHEAGHTLGLAHDGDNSQPAGSAQREYYSGHGSGSTSWGPIMGAAYSRAIVQWSRGEYPNANNPEDDVAIIAGLQPTPLTGATNGTGLISDESGSQISEAVPIAFSGPEVISQSGVITTAADEDIYSFSLGTTRLLDLVVELAPNSPNLDSMFQLLDASGNLLASDSPDGELAASIIRLLGAGNYYVRVRGTGHGTPQTNGYSTYGSLGGYRLSGRVQDASVLPTIHVQPDSQTLAGGSVIFTVQAGGAGSLHYKWMKNGVDLVESINTPSVNSPNLLLRNLGSGDAGRYSVRVTNDFGSAVSSEAILTIASPPAFTNRPLTKMVVLGGAVEFLASASGSGPVSYQWKRNGAVIPGATAASYSIASAQAIDDGYYEVRATDSIGSASSYFHLKVAAPDLTVVGWGDNQYGVTTPPPGLTDIADVAAAAGHVIALKTDGTVVAWGRPSAPGAQVPSNLQDVVAIAANNFGSFALRSNGTLVTWGETAFGSTVVPAGLSKVISIGVTNYFSVAALADGTFVHWGSDGITMGELPRRDIVEVTAGSSQAYGLRANGTVVSLGPSLGDTGGFPPTLTNVRKIVSNNSLHLVLTAEGTVVGWGDENSAPPPGLANVHSIAAGSAHGLAVTGDGAMHVWGNNAFGQGDVPNGFGGFFAAGAGEGTSFGVLRPNAPLILTQPANVVANLGAPAEFRVAVVAAPTASFQWRRNGANLVDGDGITGVTTSVLRISQTKPGDAGRYDVVATNVAGSAVSAFAELSLRLPPHVTTAPRTLVAPVGGSIRIEATVTDAETYRWTLNSKSLIDATGPVLELTNIRPRDRGFYVVEATNPAGTTRFVFFLHVADNYRVRAWGSGAGIANAPPGVGSYAGISAGLDHVLAVNGDGSISAWGANDFGQTSIPVGLSGVVQVAAGDKFSVALRDDGTVVAWGRNDLGQAQVPSGLNRVVQISAGSNHAIALRSDGTVVAWGDSSEGKTLVPASMGFAYFVDAGIFHSVAATDKGVWGWGRNDSGQVPAGSFAGTWFRSVQAATSSTLALADLGDLVRWGNPQPSNLGPLRDFTVRGDDVLGLTHGLNLRNSGSVPLPASTGDVDLISSGAGFNVALVHATAPTINQQPESLKLAAGSTATFSVEGGWATNLQWYKNGEAVANGGRSAVLTLGPLQFPDEGTYYVELSNEYGVTQSERVDLDVLPLILSVKGTGASTDNSRVTLGATATASASAVSYQWFRGRSGDTSDPIDQGTSSTIEIGRTTAEAHVWVRATNGAGSVDSDALQIGLWTLIEPAFTGGLGAVAYGQNRYVVVGTQASSSADTLTWERASIESGASLYTAVFGAGRFVAGGEQGQVFSSEDGRTWIKRVALDSNVAGSLRGASFGQGRFVLGGLKNALLTSGDGLSWTTVPVGNSNEAIYLPSVALGNSRFVAVGADNVSNTGRIFTSTDGVSWAPVAFNQGSGQPKRVLTHVFNLNGRFTAFGEIPTQSSSAFLIRSDDGLVWTAPVELGRNLPYEMAAGNGVFVAGDVSSIDGTSWAASTPALSGKSALGFANGYLFAARSEQPTQLVVSVDGFSWDARAGFPLGQSIAYGNGRFVSVASQKASVSSDAFRWKTISFSNTVLGSVTFRENYFYIPRAHQSDPNYFYKSTDGDIWTPVTNREPGTSNVLQKFAKSPERWIAHDGSVIYSSEDGVSWAPRHLGNTVVTLGWGGNSFVGFGIREARRTVFQSDDGLDWVELPMGATVGIRSVAYGNGTFVGIESTGIWTSTNGRDWKRRLELSPFGGVEFTGVVFDAGEFVVRRVSDLLTSKNGREWTENPRVLPDARGGSEFIVAQGHRWMTIGIGQNALWLRAPGETAPDLVGLTADTFTPFGSTVTLQVQATGGGLTYQWYRGTSGNTAQPVSGATGAMLTTDPVTSVSRYWVRVTNAHGLRDSPTITISPATMPVIASVSPDVEVPQDSTVDLQVIASGSPGLSYQWYRGTSGNVSSPIPTAGAATITVVSSTEIQKLWVRVSTPIGSVDSDSVTVTPWLRRSGPQELDHLQYLNGGLIAQSSDGQTLTSMDGAYRLNPNGGGPTERMAWGNGVYVGARNESGRFAIYTSEDLQVWTKRLLPDAFKDDALSETAFGQGRFVTGSSRRGGIMVSSDGITWLRRTFGAGESGVSITSVIFDEGRFLATGNEGGDQYPVVLSSSNGLDWVREQIRLDFLPDHRFAGAARIRRAGPKLFVLVESSIFKIFSSRDGRSWEPLPVVSYRLESPRFKSVAWVNGVYVFGTRGRQYFTSSDGVQLTEMTGPEFLAASSLLANNGYLLAAGKGVVASSVNGATWTMRVGYPTGGHVLGVIDGGFAMEIPGDVEFRSPDGIRWVRRSRSYLYDSLPVQGGGKYLLPTSSLTGGYYTSPDGVAWERMAIPGFAGYIARLLRVNDLFVALGNTGQIATSPDGITWRLTSVGSNVLCTALMHGNGRYVLLTDSGTIGPQRWISSDLASWSLAPAQEIKLREIQFFNGQFVAASTSSILTSVDGLSWTARHSITGSGDPRVDYDGSRYVLVRGDNKVYLSPDAINWTTMSMPSEVYDVASAAGTFVLLGTEVWQSLPHEAPAPRIVQAPEHVNVSVGSTFALSVEALGQQMAYSWRRDGVVLTDGANFLGSDTPILTINSADLGKTGSYDVVVRNPGGTVTSSSAVVQVSMSSPVVLSQPRSQSGVIGGVAVFSIQVESDGPVTYQWFKNGVALAESDDAVGTRKASFGIRNISSASAGTYSVSVGYGSGSLLSENANLSVFQPTGSAPSLVAQPRNVAVAAGKKVILMASAGGGVTVAGDSRTLNASTVSNFTYQWFKVGVGPVPGATGPMLVLPGASANDAGQYYCVIMGPGGAVTTNPASVTLADSNSVPGYLSALSVRGNVGAGANAYFIGFVLDNPGGRILVKSVGPGIAASPFNVPGAMADPKLDLQVAGSELVFASNDNWGGTPQLIAANAEIGAFPMNNAASRDAALFQNLTGGTYIATASGVNQTSGVSLIEFYGMDRPSNLSALSLRGHVGTGADVLFIGFVISGDTAKTVMIKAVGPGIASAPFNVPGSMQDPKLDLILTDGTTMVAANDDWAGLNELAQANAETGSFVLNNSSSRDAMMLVTLPPGTYIARVSGVADTTGVTLVEFYGQ